VRAGAAPFLSQGADRLTLAPLPRKGAALDLNLVVLCGRLAAPAEIRQFESGSRLARYLVTVRSEEPRRVDVVPVTLWDPPADLVDAEPAPGQPVWVAGSVQLRFWSGAEGRRSRLEVVADQVCLRSGVGE
jgi:single-strand DNA-binding protein